MCAWSILHNIQTAQPDKKHPAISNKKYILYGSSFYTTWLHHFILTDILWYRCIQHIQLESVLLRVCSLLLNDFAIPIDIPLVFLLTWGHTYIPHICIYVYCMPTPKAWWHSDCDSTSVGATLAVNVQTGTEGHTWMLTLWTLTFRIDPSGVIQERLATRLKSQGSAKGASHVRIWLHWSHAVLSA